MPYFLLSPFVWCKDTSCRYNSIDVIQVAACGTFNVPKRYHISVQILSFAISVQNTANMCKRHTIVFAFSCRFILCFSLDHLFSFPTSIKKHVNFIADRRNIMQALSECLELTHSLNNFVLGNKTKYIMKTSVEKANRKAVTICPDREEFPPRTRR